MWEVWVLSYISAVSSDLGVKKVFQSGSGLATCKLWGEKKRKRKHISVYAELFEFLRFQCKDVSVSQIVPTVIPTGFYA